MDALYGKDLAYIQAVAFGALARGAAPEIVRLLRSAPIPIQRVLDLGCGAGVLSSALVDAGFEVTGIDISSELLRIARAAVPEANFQQGSIYDMDLPSCQAVLAIGEPLTYHSDGDAECRLSEFFHRVSQVLPVGGMLIFDVIEAGEPSLTGQSWYAGEDWAVLVSAEEQAQNRKLVREIEVFRKEGELYHRGRETHHVRLFEARVLSKQLQAAGFSFTTAQAYGSYPLGQRRRAFFATRSGDQTRQ
jgi:SAM-dependent methyltransferase